MAWSCGPGYLQSTTMARVPSADVDETAWAVASHLRSSPGVRGHLPLPHATTGGLLTGDLRVLMRAPLRTVLAG